VKKARQVRHFALRLHPTLAGQRLIPVSRTAHLLHSVVSVPNRKNVSSSDGAMPRDSTTRVERQ